MSAIDPRALRDAFGAFLTGVTVVTGTEADGTPIGYTANSFSSVSLEPPLLSVCISKRSKNAERFRCGPGFAVNILSESQQTLAQTFARPDVNRFATVAWRHGPRGAPILEGVCAWFDCALHRCVDAGDHLLLLGRIEGVSNVGGNGLGYARGIFFTPALQERAVAAVAAHAPVVIGAVVERDREVLLVPAPGGGLTIPSAEVGHGDETRSDLDRLLGTFGLPASPGFIYAVFTDTVTGARHVVYRCSAGGGEPLAGEFHPLGAVPFDRIEDRPAAAMLRRFISEIRVGNFGVYFGDEREGEVHRPQGEGNR